jgi:hypothetical protein
MAKLGQVYNVATNAVQMTCTSIRVCVDSCAGDAGGRVTDGLLSAVCLLAATFALVGGLGARDALCSTKNKIVLIRGVRKEHHEKAGGSLGSALRHEWRNRLHAQLAVIPDLLQFLSVLLGAPSSLIASVGAIDGTDLESYLLRPLVVGGWLWLCDQIVERLKRLKKEILEIPFDELSTAVAELQISLAWLTGEMQEIYDHRDDNGRAAFQSLTQTKDDADLGGAASVLHVAQAVLRQPSYRWLRSGSSPRSPAPAWQRAARRPQRSARCATLWAPCGSASKAARARWRATASSGRSSRRCWRARCRRAPPRTRASSSPSSLSCAGASPTRLCPPF